MRVPLPSLVKVPPPVPIAVVVKVVLPDPPTVNAIPAPVTPPVKVRIPASELIRLSVARVTAPDQVLLLARLRKAPPLDIPDEFNEIGSAIVNPFPLI